jgi:hypothetical protein
MNMMVGLSTRKKGMKYVTNFKNLHLISRYQENSLRCDVILNIEYHVAFNNDIHTTPSISEHQTLNVGITKKNDIRSNHCNFHL